LMRRRLRDEPAGTQEPDVWSETRHRAVPDAPQPVRSASFSYGYMQRAQYSFLNCTQDAFTNAASTLAKRVSQFGAGSAPVRSWVAAQDLVFGNCDGETGPPAPAGETLPQIIRKDRDYQIAAAAFYRGDFDDAHARFLRIADDTDSPWAALSRYVAARALVRKATLAVPEEENRSYSEMPFIFQSEPMAQAQSEVRGILADPKLQAVHRAAKQLLNFIESRMTPAAYLKQIAATLAEGSSPTTIRDDLADYTMLRDKDIDSDDDMTDWISTFQEGAQHSSFVHAVEKWQQTGSVLWLVAAIVHADSKDGATPSLLDAAKAIVPSSPGYVTVRYHRIRLLRDLSRDAEWQPEVDEVLRQAAKAGPSTRNALLAMRLPLSSSLDEFIRDGVRQVVGYTSQAALSEPIPYLGDDAVATINEWLTLDDLVAMAGRPMPDEIQRTILIAAWTRAMLLNRADVARVIGPQLAKKRPEVAEAVRQYLATPERDRRNEAVFMLIQYPGMSPYAGTADTRNATSPQSLTDEIHTYQHENWWGNGGQPFYGPGPYGMKPKFARSIEEQDAIQKTGSGATYVLRQLVRWAGTHPSDPRLPKALSEAIKTTRWACPDHETRAAAKTAYDVLHSKYASTKWAKITPYWYDGKN
ncbi:MAG TPA: hypothetical protein VF505_14615, partial [Thermoanaerobaculia bacterium]